MYRFAEGCRTGIISRLLVYCLEGHPRSKVWDVAFSAAKPYPMLS